MALVSAKTMFPEPQILPTTVNLSEGVVVAIPTLPSFIAKVVVAAVTKVEVAVTLP